MEINLNHTFLFIFQGHNFVSFWLGFSTESFVGGESQVFGALRFKFVM